MLLNNLNPFSTLNNENFFQKSMDWSNQINHGSRSRGAETRSSERLLSISRQTSKGNTIGGRESSMKFVILLTSCILVYD